MDLLVIIAALISITLPQTEGQDQALVDSLRQSLRDAVSGTTQAARPPQGVSGTGPQAGPQAVPQAVPTPAPVPPAVPSGDSPQDKLNLFSGQIEDPVAANAATTQGQIFNRFSRSVQDSVGQRGSAAVQSALADPRLRSDMDRVCEQSKVPRNPCIPGYEYRTPDGSCNHPDVTVTLGASLTPQPRILDPVYETKGNRDDLPRSKGKNNKPLKSAREISNVVFSTTPAFTSPKSTKFTLTLVHFGQFVDHDIIATPSSGQTNFFPNGSSYESPIEDCDKDCDNPKNEECFPLRIPVGDDNFINPDCLHFVRRKPAPNPDCTLGPRQQRNDRTSFVDLSSTYGSSVRRYRDLREFTGGRLNASKGDLLPFGPAVEDCLSSVQQCFNSGDDRHQEIPMLTVIHINFLREHNRIAAELQKINKHWNDEKLFQEAKKILSAIYQHIVYNEYLPTLLGTFPAYSKGLLSYWPGHRNVYNKNVDPATRNEFGVAAYRFGHSLVGRFVNALDKKMRPVIKSDGDLMRHDFFNNSKIRDNKFGPTGIGRWMANTPMRKFDRFISDQVRNHLFENTSNSDANGGKSDGFDLAAFNIHRGRDHGIPGYNEYRKWCGLQPAYTFTSGGLGFRDHDKHTVKQFAKVYSNPDDVDLFAGGISEIPLQPEPNFGGILGPTFSCMIANQFRRYKEGDRFWYENPFADTGFTAAQLNNIKKQKFAGIYCRSLGLKKVQNNVFKQPSLLNQRWPCSILPKPDLELWRERRRPRY